MMGLGLKGRLGRGSIRAGVALVLMAALAVGMQAAPNLVGQWVLNETAGPTSVDSANGNNGTWIGAPTSYTPVAGPIASWSTASLSVTRPGQNYVEIPNSALLENVQEASYTLMAWFNPISTPPSDTATGQPNQNEGMYGILYKTGWHEGIGYNNNGAFVFDKWVMDGGGMNDWDGTGTWGTNHPIGQWYHVAGVADFTATQTRIYVNGNLMNTNTWTAGYSQPYRQYGTNPWRIGIANPAGGYTNWEYQADGYIDDVRIYDRVLTLAEIQAIASGTDMGAFVPPAPPPPPPPAAPATTREGKEGCGCSTISAIRGLPALGFLTLLAGLLLVLRRR